MNITLRTLGIVAHGMLAALATPYSIGAERAKGDSAAKLNSDARAIRAMRIRAD